jgi:hypothetical protein
MIIRKLYEIPTSITHSLGQITATFPSASYNVNLTGLSANTLYFLYTRKVSNVASLVYSTTVPSTYRVSFPDAVLVGAFYSNGLVSVGFGSFVNIEGVPSTNNPVSSALTMDATTPFTRTVMTWSRRGSDIYATMSALKDGSNGTGATPFEIFLPTNLPNFAFPGSSPSTTALISQENGGNLGYLSATQINAVADWIDLPLYVVAGTNTLRILAQPTGTGTIVKSSISAGATLQGFLTPLPLISWNSNSLKDL